MTRSALISRVRAALNDIQPFDEGAVVESVNLPTKPVLEYISYAVDASLTEVLLIAPTDKLKVSEHLLTDAELAGERAGSKKYYAVQMPDGYLHFASAQMSGWRRSVDALSDMRGYLRQLHDATMATAGSPCAYELTLGSRKVLHLFPRAAESASEHIYYVKSYDGLLGDEEGSGTEKYVSDEVAEAIVYGVAVKVAIYFGRDVSSLVALYSSAMSAVLGKAADFSQYWGKKK
jgi:hypothetical protein